MSTVYIVQGNQNKDISEARKFGDLQAVFVNPQKPYDTDKLLEEARSVLDKWEDGDHLLMLGDPALCAIAAVVASETTSALSVLSWERSRFTYSAQEWDFGYNDENMENV